MPTLRLRLSRERARAALLALPGVLAGRLPDPGGTVRQLAEAVGVEALSIIKQEFVVKARGGTDGAGIVWKPLSPAYVAYKRRHPGLPPAAQRRPRHLLTAAQDRLWRGVFVGVWHSLQGKGLADDEAKGLAAAKAWRVVTAAGGRTLLETYGGAPAEIGRDTGRLLASLSPELPGPDRVLEAAP